MEACRWAVWVFAVQDMRWEDKGETRVEGDSTTAVRSQDHFQPTTTAVRSQDHFDSSLTYAAALTSATEIVQFDMMG